MQSILGFTEAHTQIIEVWSKLNRNIVALVSWLGYTRQVLAIRQQESPEELREICSDTFSYG